MGLYPSPKSVFSESLPSTLDSIVLYISRKLSIWGFQKSGWKSIFDILWSVTILGTHPDTLVFLVLGKAVIFASTVHICICICFYICICICICVYLYMFLCVYLYLYFVSMFDFGSDSPLRVLYCLNSSPTPPTSPIQWLHWHFWLPITHRLACDTRNVSVIAGDLIPYNWVTFCSDHVDLVNWN